MAAKDEEQAEKGPNPGDVARNQLEALGQFIRDKRKQAEYSLRDLADRANVSNPYLSQIERGLHTPSVRVLKAIAAALNVSAESLLVQAGLLEANEGDEKPLDVEDAIRADPKITDDQKAAILAVYRSYIAQNTAAKLDEGAAAS